MASINAVVKALCRQHTALHGTSSGDVAYSWPYDLIWTALLGLTVRIETMMRKRAWVGKFNFCFGFSVLLALAYG